VCGVRKPPGEETARRLGPGVRARRFRSTTRIASPSFLISATLRRRSFFFPASLRTSSAGLEAMTSNRVACARRLCSVDTVRAATPRPPPRGFAVFPAAMSDCIASMSASLSARTCRRPSSGLMCASIQYRSMASVDSRMVVPPELVHMNFYAPVRPPSHCRLYWIIQWEKAHDLAYSK
jgi:hypothetical protein